MSENDDTIERAELDSPDRCQATTTNGQCTNKGARLEGGRFANYCRVHGGNKTQEAESIASRSNYRLTKWQARLEEKAEHKSIKSLRDEVGILRIIMEERLERCNDNVELLLHAAPISDLVTKIERTVLSCHKLEGSMGQLLDKQAILQFAQIVIGIISDVLSGEEAKIDAIATRILATVSAVGMEEE